MTDIISRTRLHLAAGLIGLALIGLSACAPNPTPYQPAMGKSQYGFSEQQLEENRFRVTFTGNADTPRQMVENALLYRCAELTKARGYDYFVMTTQDTDSSTRYRSTFTGYTGFGYYRHNWPWYGPGYGYGGGMGPDTAVTYPITTYSAYAEIVLMKGKKELNDIKAFSADDVLAKVGPSVYRGKPKP